MQTWEYSLVAIPDRVDLLYVSQINQEHELAQQSITDWFLHAVTIGRILVEARRTVTDRPWTQWTKENLTFTHT